MNLPASAVEFLDAFRGAFDPQAWAGRQLPLVHVYTFMKGEGEAGGRRKPRSHFAGSVPCFGRPKQALSWPLSAVCGSCVGGRGWGSCVSTWRCLCPSAISLLGHVLGMFSTSSWLANRPPMPAPNPRRHRARGSRPGRPPRHPAVHPLRKGRRPQQAHAVHHLPHPRGGRVRGAGGGAAAQQKGACGLPMSRRASAGRGGSGPTRGSAAARAATAIATAWEGKGGRRGAPAHPEAPRPHSFPAVCCAACAKPPRGRAPTCKPSLCATTDAQGVSRCCRGKGLHF
jgi:hypothetical protein